MQAVYALPRSLALLCCLIDAIAIASSAACFEPRFASSALSRSPCQAVYLSFGVLQNGCFHCFVVVAVVAAIFGFEFLALSQISVLTDAGGGQGACGCNSRKLLRQLQETLTHLHTHTHTHAVRQQSVRAIPPSLSLHLSLFRCSAKIVES